MAYWNCVVGALALSQMSLTRMLVPRPCSRKNGSVLASVNEESGPNAVVCVYTGAVASDSPDVQLNQSHQPFSEARDLFGDGSLLSVDLPGHATGQAGLFLKEANGRDCLLAADACWLSRAFRENQMPHPLVRMLVDWSAYRRTLQLLHELHCGNPSLRIIPSHCPEIWEAKA